MTLNYGDEDRERHSSMQKNMINFLISFRPLVAKKSRKSKRNLERDTMLFDRRT